MNASEFGKLYAKTYGVSNEYGRTVCESVFHLLGKVLYEDGKDVTIQRFGSFRHKTMSEKKVRHPVCGEMLVMPQRSVIKFKPSEYMTGMSEKKGEENQWDEKIEPGDF